MTQHLTDLLNRYADVMAEGHPVPAAPPARPTTEDKQRWLRRSLIPVGAAASVAAVALGASLLHGHASPPRVIAAAAGGEPERVQPGDTAPPPPVLGPPDPSPPQGPPPPAERAQLEVSVELPPSATVDELTSYTAVLQNPTDVEIALRPCPTYRMEFGGQAVIGRLPCDKLPDAMDAGQTLRIDLAATMGFWDGPDTTDRDIGVTWAIGGPPAARGRLTLKPIPLGEPVDVAPFSNEPAPPGEPVDGVVGLQHHMRPEWNLTPTIITAPSTVRAGETFRYTVRLVNVSPRDPVHLRPCRGFTQWLQRPLRPAGEQVAFLDWSFERHEITSLQSQEYMINCSALPQELPARRWVQLEMQMQVPADYAPGPASLAWKVGELDVFGSMQSRYVTLNIVK